jgi:predicted RNA-binding Zn-ribbon protein involved in translation (DUF1610 family)
VRLSRSVEYASGKREGAIVSASKKGRRARHGERGAADALASSIEPIISKLEDIKAEARALGIFTGDRELLACPRCGLLEDVLVDGRLITCREESLGEDTGLRFVEAEGTADRFVCPDCGSEVALDRDD